MPDRRYIQLAILTCSGLDWTDRTKRPLARAPDLDIFSQALVIRYDHGWQISEAGLALLAAIKSPAAPTVQEAPQDVQAEPPGIRHRHRCR